MPLSIMTKLFMAFLLLFGGPRASVAGQVVTVVTTSIATAFSECTCALTVSDPSSSYETPTASMTVDPLVTTELSRNTISPTSVSSPTAGTTAKPAQGSLSICPTRIRNPTYTAPFPQPTDYTWGCPPHYLCQPDKKTPDGECNFEAGPPADTYYCSPDQCTPSPPLLPPQFGGASNRTGDTGLFEVSPGYFNLNPHEFGLEYDIFIFPAPFQHARRELSVQIPGKCYDPCNDAMLEAESTSKTAGLCVTDAAFLTLVRACQSCVASFDLPRKSATVLPEFQQFVFYCDGLQSQTASASIQSPTSVHKATALATISLNSTPLAAKTKQKQSYQTISMITDAASTVTIPPSAKASLSSTERIVMVQQSSMDLRTTTPAKNRSSLMLPSSTPRLINGASAPSPYWTLGYLLMAATVFFNA